MIVKFKHFSITIDKEDYSKICICNWYLQKKNKHILNGDNITMGRIILNYYGPLEINHKDRDYFNFKKDNLRLATRAQQVASKGPIGKNKYKGVYWDKTHKCWAVYLKFEGKSKFVGNFYNETEAAMGYNKAAKKYWGEFAYLNDV